MQHYKPLQIKTLKVAGAEESLMAMRLPMPQRDTQPTFEDDLFLASKLIKGGDDHAKAMRGILVWVELQCQVGWLLEYEQYEVGVTRLSSSSSMHSELKLLKGAELAEQKQIDLATKVYTLVDVISYQTIRRIYIARQYHRHPDWHIYRRDFVESLPYFDRLINP